jgi:hypothetical protein
MKLIGKVKSKVEKEQIVVAKIKMLKKKIVELNVLRKRMK